MEVNMNNFNFLLFVLDSLERRKLPCDGNFYANILFESARLGALPKKIGSLLVKSKKKTIELQMEQKSLSSLFSSDQMRSSHDDIIPTWTTMYEHWDSKKYREVDPELPVFRVRIGSKDIRQILAAEQAVSSYRGTRMNRRNRNFKSKRSKSSVI